MDEDAIIAAAVAQVRSTIKQAIRKITGETRTQADDAQSAAGNTKDAASARPPK